MEDKQKHISHVIHDQLGQALTGLMFNVAYLNDRLNADTIDRKQLRDRAEAALALLNDTLEVVRTPAFWMTWGWWPQRVACARY